MDTSLAVPIVGMLLAFVAIGIPIVVALGIASFLGILLVTGQPDVALALLSGTAYEAIRDYIFAVIPLFVLMGEFVAKSGAAADLFTVINRLLRRLPARLAVATVFGNAIFAAVVGVSVASAAVFSRLAYPQMMARGYRPSTALGCIAGSSSLGMLIPPSILMIVWGFLTELSIGKLFLAGVIPGIVLALLYALYLMGAAWVAPTQFGADAQAVARGPAGTDSPLDRTSLVGGGGTLLLVLVVLGGIWLGWFTPTEAAGVGAVAALGLALAKGLGWREIREAILDTGRISAPILFLLIFAQMYSRLLVFGGVVTTIQDAITGLALAPWMVMALMVAIWFVLGMFVESVSILLLTVPVFAPIAVQLGYDPYQFAIIGILAIECGILTPPFGLVVFTVKAVLGDPRVTLADIFKGAVPYWAILLVLIVVIGAVPALATWLPSM
jgi:tripartite ATP-independent transporter DctM subunit